MAKMRAMVLHKWGGPLQLEQLEVPKPGPGEVLVDVEACGVGLTVMNIIRGYLVGKPEYLPVVPGHEIAGVIAEVGEGVTTVKVGDRVLTSFYLTCGHCEFCRKGREPLCLNFRGFVGEAINGGYAEYTCLPAANCLPLPADIPFVEASAINDAIGTPYHVCNSRAKVRPGDRVAIIGAAGGVGIHMVQMAKLFGGEVIAVDIDDEKLARTKEYGASWTINFRSPDPDQRIAEATNGRGPDAIIDLVGTQQTCDWAVQVLARDGRIVHLTTFPNVQVKVAPGRLVGDEIVIMGSRYVNKWELLEAIELVRKGKIKPVVSEVVPLERVAEINQKLLDATFFGRGALIP